MNEMTQLTRVSSAEMSAVDASKDRLSSFTGLALREEAGNLLHDETTYLTSYIFGLRNDLSAIGRNQLRTDTFFLTLNLRSFSEKTLNSNRVSGILLLLSAMGYAGLQFVLPWISFYQAVVWTILYLFFNYSIYSSLRGMDQGIRQETIVRLGWCDAIREEYEALEKSIEEAKNHVGSQPPAVETVPIEGVN